MTDPEIILPEARQEDFSALQIATIPQTQNQVIAQRAQADLFGRVITAQPVQKPRDYAVLKKKLGALAAINSDGYLYGWEVKKKDGTKEWIEGPTIELANDLAREYGNNQIEVAIQESGTHWIIYARFTDLETGYSLVRPFQQRKAQSSGGKMAADRMLDIAFQIGASKAIRNVVVNALSTFAKFMQEEAKRGFAEWLAIPKNRTKVEERIAACMDLHRITLRRVEAVIGRPKAQWTVKDVAQLYTMVKGIEEGTTEASDLFPEVAGGTAREGTSAETSGKPADTAGASDATAKAKTDDPPKMPDPVVSPPLPSPPPPSPPAETKAAEPTATPATAKKAAKKPAQLFGES